MELPDRDWAIYPSLDPAEPFLAQWEAVSATAHSAIVDRSVEIDAMISEYHQRAADFNLKMHELGQKARMATAFTELIEEGLWWKLKYSESRESADIEAYEHQMEVEMLKDRLSQYEALPGDLKSAEPTAKDKRIEDLVFETKRLKEQMMQLRSERDELRQFQQTVLADIKRRGTDAGIDDDIGMDEGIRRTMTMSPSSVKSLRLAPPSPEETKHQQRRNTSVPKRAGEGELMTDFSQILKQVRRFERQLMQNDRALFASQAQCRSLEERLTQHQRVESAAQDYFGQLMHGLRNVLKKTEDMHRTLNDYFDRKLKHDAFRSQVFRELVSLSQALDIMSSDMKVRQREIFVTRASNELPSPLHFASGNEIESPASSSSDTDDETTLGSNKASTVSALLDEIRNRAPNLRKIDQQPEWRRMDPLRLSLKNLRHHLKYAIEKHRLAMTQDDVEEAECWSDH